MVKLISSEREIDELIKAISNCDTFLNSGFHDNIGGVDIEHFRENFKSFLGNLGMIEGTRILAGRDEETNVFNSILIFDISRGGLNNKKLVSRELIWVHAEKTASAAKNSLEAFRMANKISEELGCDYITFSTIQGSKHSKRVEKFYEKNGYVLESKTYIKTK